MRKSKSTNASVMEVTVGKPFSSSSHLSPLKAGTTRSSEYGADVYVLGSRSSEASRGGEVCCDTRVHG